MLIVLYKLGDAFALSLSTTFLIRGVGFDAGQVGMINKSLGLLATLVGTLAGGLLMQRLSLFRALLLFGLLQTVSNAGYWALAVNDKHLWSMAAAVFVENLCGGMGTAAFVALLSALAAVGRVYIGPLAGWFVELHGWAWFYLFSVAISFPGLGLLMLCRTTLTLTQHTGEFLHRGHFNAGYRLAQRLLAAGGVLVVLVVLAKAAGMVSTGTIMNLCWKIGALLLTVSILMGCVLDYRAMKRSR